MPIFIVNASIRLHAPLKDDAGQVVAGAFQSIGVTAPSVREMRRLLEECVSEGAVDWSDSDVEAYALEELHEDWRAMAEGRTTDGIWYRSGLIFYPTEE